LPRLADVSRNVTASGAALNPANGTGTKAARIGDR